MPDQLFITFGVQYARQPHPLLIHPDGVVVVEGETRADAYVHLFEATKGQHAFDYPMAELQASVARYYPLGVIGRIDADGYHPIRQFQVEEHTHTTIQEIL